MLTSVQRIPCRTGAFAALKYPSCTNALTGLPNRRAIVENLETIFSHAQKVGCHITLAYIDLDGFKAINDHYGHHCGDRFLQQAGKRLLAFKTEDGLVGRLGSDEFLAAVLCSSKSEQAQFVSSLREQLCGDYSLAEMPSTIREPVSA